MEGRINLKLKQLTKSRTISKVRLKAFYFCSLFDLSKYDITLKKNKKGNGWGDEKRRGGGCSHFSHTCLNAALKSFIVI